jgi:hypothetical protein
MRLHGAFLSYGTLKRPFPNWRPVQSRSMERFHTLLELADHFDERGFRWVAFTHERSSFVLEKESIGSLEVATSGSTRPVISLTPRSYVI